MRQRRKKPISYFAAIIKNDFENFVSWTLEKTFEVIPVTGHCIYRIMKGFRR